MNPKIGKMPLWFIVIIVLFIPPFLACDHVREKCNPSKIIVGQYQVMEDRIGIPKDKQGELFKAFTQVDSSITRRFGGTGLGLSITKALIEMMGGVISVHSEPGKGAEFTFTLQLSPGKAAVESDITPIEMAELKGKKVLILDDNANTRELLENYCRYVEMEITHISSNVSEVLEWLKAPEHCVDVMLCDIMVPVMGDFSLAQLLRRDERFKEVKLIALTSDATPGSADASERAGFDAYLSKPFARKELYAILRTVFGDKRREKHQIITRHLAQELLAKGISILVVEDNEINRKLMGILLKQLGCVFDMANNGQEALAKVREKKYDRILMDIQMPVMDGIQATRSIRNDLKLTTPIIALTAHAFKEDEKKCKEAGMDDHLPKPVDKEILKEKIITWAKYK